jgi:ABC-2 type transport system ATP-binding protein
MKIPTSCNVAIYKEDGENRPRIEYAKNHSHQSHVIFHSISDSILENLNLAVSAGEFIGILGHNGVGKTTLMDLLMGFRKSSKGLLEIIGEDPHAIARAHRKDVVFLSQEVSMKSSISIKQFLKFHAFFYDSYSLEEEAYLLKEFQLDPEARIGSPLTGQ